MTQKCIKCGGDYEVVGLEATNKAMPNAKVRMLQCTCTKCGFMEFRMEDKGLDEIMGTKAED